MLLGEYKITTGCFKRTSYDSLFRQHRVLAQFLDKPLKFPIVSNGMGENRPVLKPKRIAETVLLVLFALAFIIGIGLLLIARVYGGIGIVKQRGFVEYSVSSTAQLKKELALFSDDYRAKMVKPYLLKSLPPDFGKCPAKERVKLFIKVMLPIALVANEHFEAQRKILLRICSKMRSSKLSKSDKRFLNALEEKYKTKNVKILLRRVSGVPVGLLIAQAAIESGWGASYFALRYNNIYGIHRLHVRKGEPIVVVYKSLYDATISYIMNLNTNPAYKNFRIARASMGDHPDPYILANYLLFYSVKRHRYVRLLKTVLVQQRLCRYADFRLTHGFWLWLVNLL